MANGTAAPNVPHYHLITARYLGPTNTRGTRIKLQSARFDQTVTVPYHSEGSLTTALSWLAAHGFTVVCTGETFPGYAIMVREFLPLHS